MFRLYTKTDAEVVSSMHHPLYAITTDSLHSMGQKLSHGVCRFISHRAPYTFLMNCNFLHHSQLFGEDEDAAGELDEAEKQGENGEPLSFRPSHVLAVYAGYYRPTF